MDQKDQPAARRGKAQAIVHYFGKLDLFRVVQDQEHCLTSASTSGAVVSVLTSIFIAVLMLQNTYLFFKGEVRSSMFVPSIRVKTEPMEPVHLSVSFPAMPCNMLGISIVDKHGNMLPDLMGVSVVKKTRLSPGDWKKPLTPYTDGMSVDQNEGCKLDGTIMIDKVPGHFLVGAMGHQGGQRGGSQHFIHEMWIGSERLNKRKDGIEEDLVNPLRELNNTNEKSDTMFKFFLQVVPTYFRNDKGGKVKKLGYQYTASATKISAPHMPPGLYFSHRHSTLAVEYRFVYQTWSHFVVSLCAIAGGVFTVMSFINSAVETLGCTPTSAKVGNFVANYMAGRRKRGEVQQYASAPVGGASSPALSPLSPLHAPGSSPMQGQPTQRHTAALSSSVSSGMPFSPMHSPPQPQMASPPTFFQPSPLNSLSGNLNANANVGGAPFGGQPAMFAPPTFVPPGQKKRTD